MNTQAPAATNSLNSRPVVGYTLAGAPGGAGEGSLTTETETRDLVRMLPISEIKTSSENEVVYGGYSWDNDDDRLLYSDVKRDGILEPLHVSEDGYLLSGHRRKAVALMLGMEAAPCLVRPIRRLDHNPAQWLQILKAYNSHRVKTLDEIAREVVVEKSPEVAHLELLRYRIDKATPELKRLDVTGGPKRKNLSGEKADMMAAILEVLETHREELPVSERRVHYLLATCGRPILRNTNRKRWKKMRRRRNGQLQASEFYGLDKWSSKDLSGVLTRLRCDGRVPWEAIVDDTRPSDILPTCDNAADFMRRERDGLFRGYRRRYLQSQSDHYEVFLEKLGLRQIIRPVCDRYAIQCTIGKGYSSADVAYRMAERYRQSGKVRLVLFVMTDFDPDGLALAEAVGNALHRDHKIQSEMIVSIRVGIHREQAEAMGLPANCEPKDIPKSARFKREHGNTVYELDAAPASYLCDILDKAIRARVDVDLYNGELTEEAKEAAYLDAARQRVLAAMGGL